LVTDGDTNDVRIAQRLEFAPGTIVVMDRGYLDYALYEKWTQHGVYFVTRPRTNMLYEVIERRTVGTRGNIKCDESIKLADGYGRKRCPSVLRQVTVQDADNQREIVFLTNIFHLAASTVGAIYKDRWQIELFFKALKQNLKIKTFVGTSENAVKVQIWTALIAMLLLKFLLLKSTWAWSLSNLAAMLRFNLLSYRDLWAWLNAPFEVPIVVAQGEQLMLLE
jgi:IS4 transposase